jgi:hypothetical protein
VRHGLEGAGVDGLHVVPVDLEGDAAHHRGGGVWGASGCGRERERCAQRKAGPWRAEMCHVHARRAWCRDERARASLWCGRTARRRCSSEHKTIRAGARRWWC